MLSIILLILGIIDISLIILWIKDKNKWKKQYKKIEQEFRNSQLVQKEQNSQIDLLKQKRKKEQLLQKAQEQKEDLYKKNIEKWEKKQKTIRQSCAKIHLYIQLIKEQCQTKDSQQQCDIILKECKKIIETDIDY